MNSINIFKKNILKNLKTFDDLYNLDNNTYTKKQKGDFFEIFVKYIFKFHPYYKKNHWNLKKTKVLLLIF